MPADDPDLYAILGVAPDASPTQIAHAYWRLIRACHPVRHPDPDPAVLTAATAPPSAPHRHRAEPDLHAGPVRWHST